MVTHAKGLVCVSVSSETTKRLELFPMVSNNTSSYETAFTVSVDDVNAATGISAIERDNTIKILANPISKSYRTCKTRAYISTYCKRWWSISSNRSHRRKC